MSATVFHSRPAYSLPRYCRVALLNNVSLKQVKHLIAASTAASTDDVFSESKTVLNSAASSGDKAVFEAVLAELEKYWPAWRVRPIIVLTA